MTNEKYDLNEVKDICNDIIKNAEKFKRCYFWDRDNGNESARKYYGAQNSRDYHFSFNGNEYHFEQSVSQSRKNTYFHSTYSINGEIKDIRLVKKLLKLVDSTEANYEERLYG
ncbi:MAG: hypothetical protein K6E72_01960 [Saccharofermentans sp.]|nr:hypothetical protein [Saccharofermentans sp.]